MSDSKVDLENFENTAEASAEVENKAETAPAKGEAMTAVHKVPVHVRIVLGSTKMPVSEVLQLNRGAVIEIDKRVGEPVDIMINDRIVARGELMIVEDNRLGVTLTEIIKDPSDLY